MPNDSTRRDTAGRYPGQIIQDIPKKSTAKENPSTRSGRARMNTPTVQQAPTHDNAYAKSQKSGRAKAEHKTVLNAEPKVSDGASFKENKWTGKGDAMRKALAARKAKAAQAAKNTKGKTSTSKGNSGGSSGGSSYSGGRGSSASASGGGSGSGAGKSSSGGKSSKPAAKPSSKGTSSSSYLSDAERSVSLTLNPQLNELIRQRNELAKNYAGAEDKITKHGSRVDSDIKALYKALGISLDKSTANVKELYAAAAAAIDNNNAVGQAKQAELFQKQNEQQQAEMDRLGLGVPVDSRAQDDQAFFQQLGQFNRTNAANMIAQQGANDSSAATQMAANQQAVGAKTNADFQSLNTGAFNDLVKEQATKDSTLAQKYSDIESQRGALIEQALQQAEIQAYERNVEAQQQAFQNSLAMSKFNLSAEVASSNAAYRASQLQLEKAKLVASQRAAAAKTAAANKAKPPALNPRAAYQYLETTKVSGLTPEARSILANTFQNASTASEVNFTDYNNRNLVIDRMRQDLAQNHPELNIGPIMNFLSQVYDIYMGKASL